ncbi:MAG: hypothetical protein KC503_43595, partial [Myxococcales bacterium]|nr:hypothetical protein [Myxococcales bacterium]
MERSAATREQLRQLESALRTRARGRSVADALLDVAAEPELRLMLESAREQTDSLFVLPQDVVFPTDLFPLLLLVAHPQVGDFGL